MCNIIYNIFIKNGIIFMQIFKKTKSNLNKILLNMIYKYNFLYKILLFLKWNKFRIVCLSIFSIF